VVVCAGDTHAAAAASVAGDDLAEWCADRGADNAAGILAAAGVPAGRMLYPDQLPAERQLVARGFLAPLDQPDIGPLVVDRQSYRCDTLPLPPSFPAPRLGEHTRAICAELGLAPADVDRFLASGVLEE
jgi:crotonobetainyl-CoA:carnitine CoA-transferase CaiB-like acyl-CoA transferase